MHVVETILFGCLIFIIGGTILLSIWASVSERKKSYKTKVLKKRDDGEFESIYNQLAKGRLMNEAGKRQRKNFIISLTSWSFILLSPFWMGGLIIVFFNKFQGNIDEDFMEIFRRMFDTNFSLPSYHNCCLVH